MYLEHFGLSEFPFTTASDPRYYYPTARHREALACLLYAVEQRRGLALVTGEIGAGKTMLCRAALARFGPAVEPVFLTHSSLSPLEFLQAVGIELGIDISAKPKVMLLRELRDTLTARQQHGGSVVLLLDEAQGLGVDVLEEVRLLTNLETNAGKLLQIILVGQPELRHRIAAGGLRALDQRMAIKFHLGPLAPDEVGDYVDHRLRVAGAAEPAAVVSAAAKGCVADASGGVPRLINVICDQALLDAYARGCTQVTDENMRRVVDEFEGYYMVDGPVAEPLGPARQGDGRKAGLGTPAAAGPGEGMSARAARGPLAPLAGAAQPAPQAPRERGGPERRSNGASGSSAGGRPRGRTGGGALSARQFRLECPYCGTAIGVYEDEVGSRGTCPGCSAVIEVRADAFDASLSAGGR